MKRRALVVVVAALVVGTAGFGFSWLGSSPGGEIARTELKLSEAPREVQAAVLADVLMECFALEVIATTSEDGKTVYAVDYEAARGDIELLFASNGETLQRVIDRGIGDDEDDEGEFDDDDRSDDDDEMRNYDDEDEGTAGDDDNGGENEDEDDE